MQHTANDPDLGRLAAGLVHELNTPIGAVTSASDTLGRLVSVMSDDGRVPHPEALRSLADVLTQGTTRLREVVSVLERLERKLNHHSREPERIELRALVDEALAATGDVSGGLRVERRFEGRPIWISGHRPRLKHALTDLLDQARTAAPRGEITICVERIGTAAEVWIADDGPGMAPHELQSACNLHFAEHDGRVRLQFGLAACRHALELDGATLHVESTLGSGTQIRVRLPIAG